MSGQGDFVRAMEMRVMCGYPYISPMYRCATQRRCSVLNDVYFCYGRYEGNSSGCMSCSAIADADLEIVFTARKRDSSGSCH